MDLGKAVETFLRERIDGFIRLDSCDRLSGGASQETHRVAIETRSGKRLLAFRRAPGGEPGTDRVGPGLDVEAALIRLARAAGVPEPEVVAVLDGSEGLGHGFFMEWLEGETLGARIARADTFASTRPRLARQCGEILARIHAIDVHASPVLAERLQQWTPDSYIRELWTDYQGFGTPQPMIDYTARWLLANLPASDRVALVHNDFRNGNLMIRPDEGIVAVLDWEVACLGDPMRDLGWMCTNSWRFGVSELPVGGFGTYDDLFAGYESVSGTTVNRADVHFWEVFGSFWWAIGCLRMAERWRNGPDRTVERPGIARRSSECQIDCVNLIIPGPPGTPIGDTAATDLNMPRLSELTESVRDFLRQDVMHETEGRTSFLARVAANSLDIVLRETAQGPEHQRRSHAGLQDLLGRTGTYQDLLQGLVDGLRDGSIPLDLPGLAAHLRESVIRQVAIDQPGYSGYTTAMKFDHEQEERLMGMLDGKVAIVTGSGRGIGREVALQLAGFGASVVVNDLDAGPADEVVAEIKAKGGKAVACAGSVTEAGFADRFVSTAIESFGNLHIIVNNAGYTWDAVIQKMSDDQFDAMIDVHLKAPWQILKAASEFIRVKSKEEVEKQGGAVIRKVVNISSVSGTRGNAGQTNYAAGKAGVVGLTKALAREWGRYQVNVNAVAFGLIETRLTEATDEKKMIEVEGNKVLIGVPVQNIEMANRMIPMGRGGKPSEAAGAVVMLCLPLSDYVSGQMLEVTGGN